MGEEDVLVEGGVSMEAEQLMLSLLHGDDAEPTNQQAAMDAHLNMLMATEEDADDDSEAEDDDEEEEGPPNLGHFAGAWPLPLLRSDVPPPDATQAATRRLTLTYR